MKQELKQEIKDKDMKQDVNVEMKATKEVKDVSKEKKEIAIEELPGVGAATAEKLREAGFDTLMSIAVSSPAEIVEICAVGEAVAKKIINNARGKLDMGFESGDEILKKREMVDKISTGSKALDGLFGGGVESNAITEVYGEFGSGKSSIAHQIAVNVQLPKNKGGAEGMAVWLDSESTFRPERIKQLAEAVGLDPIKVLKNIKVARCFNSDHQMLVAEKVEDLIKKDKLPVKLVIVDSLMSHFRSDFSGRGQLADRQQKLNKHLHTLLKLATTFNVVVYITNQVMAKPDTFFGDPTTAVGGHVLHHACLTADTLIQTADGTIKPLGDFTQSAELTTINVAGDLHQNKGVCDRGSVRKDIKEVYEIDAGYHIKASPLHRFFRLQDFAVEEVETKDINVGDYLMTANTLDFVGAEQKLPDIKVKEMVTFDHEASRFVKDALMTKKITRKEVCDQLQIRPRQLRRVLNQEYATDKENVVALSHHCGDALLQLSQPYTSQKHRDMIMPQTLTVALAQVLGYVLGDGHVADSGLRLRDARLEIIEVYSNLLYDLFHLEGTISKIEEKQCYELSVNSIYVAQVFEELKRQAFLYISRSPKQHVRAFIRGFMDAEGYVAKDRPRVSISQAKPLTLQYIQMLLSRFGIRSSLEETRENGNLCFFLRIEGRDIVPFAAFIGVSALDKKDRLDKWVKYVTSRRFTKEIIPVSRQALRQLLSDCGLMPSHYLKPRPKSYQYINRKNFEVVVRALVHKGGTHEQRQKIEFLQTLLRADVRFERVRAITLMENKEPLYDLSVLFAENYIANGFAVHNSTYRVYLRKGKKGTRVARMIDAPHLPDSEAIFQVTEQGVRDVQ